MFHVEQLDRFQDVLKAAGLSVPDGFLSRFALYRDLLLEWNQKMNLISRHDEERIVTRHFLESVGMVVAFPFPQGARVIDLGSGAGFPGVPVKLVRPDLHMILVESKQKKVRFLNTLIGRLGVDGLEVIGERAEDLAGRLDPADIVISRSVADLATLVRWSRPLLTPRGILVAIKGSKAREEIEHLRTTITEGALRSCTSYPYDPLSSIAHLVHQCLVVLEMNDSY